MQNIIKSDIKRLVGNCLKILDIKRITSPGNNIQRLIFLMAMIFLVMTAIKPDMFFSINNFRSMAFQFPEYGIMALAIMITILTGGIDLSLVGIANLSSVLAAIILREFNNRQGGLAMSIMGIIIAIAASLAMGAACGLLNGFAIGCVSIPAIITTLGTMQLFTGFAIVVTKGAAVYGFPGIFSNIGNGTICYIPIPFIVFLLVTLLMSLMLNKTAFGLKVYNVGSNPVAARFSGIKNSSIIIKTYLISGLLASVSGLIIIARTNSAKADYGTSYTLLAILIAVLGGVNPAGGAGKVSGVVIAVLMLQFLSSGFNMLHFSNFFKDFIWGAILLAVMVVNFLINNKRLKAK